MGFLEASKSRTKTSPAINVREWTRISNLNPKHIPMPCIVNGIEGKAIVPGASGRVQGIVEDILDAADEDAVVDEYKMKQ